jgi:HD-GYP domain-containing protein (c-di-GMP phosphodiesterase class II)
MNPQATAETPEGAAPADGAAQRTFLARLAAAGEMLTSPAPAESPVAAIARALLALTEADHAAIFFRSPAGVVTCPWTHNLSERYVAELVTPNGINPWIHILRHPELACMDLPKTRRRTDPAPWIVRDVLQLSSDHAALVRENFRSMCVWPLGRDGRVIAALAYYYDAPHECSEEEQKGMRAFAAQATAALGEGAAHAVADAARRFDAHQTLEAELPPRSHIGAAPADERAMAGLAADRASLEADAERFAGEREKLAAARAEVANEETRLSESRRRLHEENVRLDTLRRDLEVREARLAGDRAALAAEAARVNAERRALETERARGTQRLAQPEAVDDASARDRRAARAEETRTPVPDVKAAPTQPQEAGGATTYLDLVERAGAANAPDADKQILAVARRLDAHNGHVANFSKLLADWAAALARARQCSDPEILSTRRAAFLHDIGKIDVPAATLKKAAGLTDDELTMLEREPAVAHQMLKDAEGLSDVATILRHRFERWDGAGHPDRLKGEAIPLGARILSVVDAYGEMITGRPGVPKLYYRDAIAALQRESGARFDPNLVAEFCRIVAHG